MAEEKTLNNKIKNPEWAPAKPEKLPRLTFWPVVLAVGVVFFFWGFVTSLIISVVGLGLSAVALYGWIGEFSDES